MFCRIASSTFHQPARARVLGAHSGVEADCLPACLLPICQCCSHAGMKGCKISREHCVLRALLVKASVWHTILQAAPRQDASASQSGGTGRSNSGRTHLPPPPPFNKALLLSVILLCSYLAITLLCYTFPPFLMFIFTHKFHFHSPSLGAE